MAEFSTDANSVSADCAGLRIEYQHAGSGPALVLLHGLLGYSFSWRRVIPKLSSNREVFAPDMPGAGFSECRDDLDCRLAAAAGRLLTFLDSLQIERCDLVGSSYGGATALAMAATAPRRVRSLTLVSPANPWSQIGRKRLALLSNPVLASIFPKIARACTPLHRFFVRRMWGNPRKVTTETLEGYSRPLGRRGIFEHAVKIVQTWHTDMAQLEATLPKLASIPVLLIWGSKDRVVDLNSAALMKQHLPHAEIAIIEGAGHLPYEECPEEFCRIVEDFLQRRTAA